MVFYLKVNRDIEYTYRNVKHWVEAISYCKNSKIIFICDNENITNKLKREYSNVEFILSDRTDNKLMFIVDNVCIDYWKKAGFAHLTTFNHAKKNGYNYFWNIDADDTCLCIPTSKVSELLIKASDFIMDNNCRVDMMSLDMWDTVVRRVQNADHWSFGITLTNNMINWIDLMCDYAEEHRNLNKILNVDTYCTYLRRIKSRSRIYLKTFYFENLMLIHYSDDLFYWLRYSGVFHWKNGMLKLPFIYDCIGATERGMLKIVDDAISFDINIKDSERLEFFENFAQRKIDLKYDILEKKYNELITFGYK